MHPLIAYIRQTLREIYDDSEALCMAKWLLVQHFGFTTVQLYGGKVRRFSANEQKELDNILQRLIKYEPLQYILGTECFYGMTFKVDKSVLIPRPETAELVDWIITENPKTGLRVLDIGTGSGCIAIALAKHLNHAEVKAWDISAQALDTARQNAERNGVQIIFEQRDVLRTVSMEQETDIIVSNPPYIAQEEKASMGKNVSAWEPDIALFVPDEDPLLFYRKIALWGRRMLRPNGKLYLEINQRFGREVTNLLANKGYGRITLKKDSDGNERMVKASL